MLQYANIPNRFAAVISGGLATLHELQTVYGTEDSYDLLEIVMVDAVNRGKLLDRGE